MKPIIGLCANYSYEEEVGTKIGIGVKGQEWQVLADDYISAIENAGGVPIILPITKDIETIVPILSQLDGILFTGGSDIDPQYYNEFPRYGLGAIDPKRDKHELQLAQKVLYEMEIPLLAICRGCQLINVAACGTLYQDLVRERSEGMNHSLVHAPKYHPTHSANIKIGSKLHTIFGVEKIGVNSFNHQAIKQVGKNFRVTMSAPDGLIEGIELNEERFVVAVQWHPEMMFERDSKYRAIFDAFVEACMC